MPGPRNAPAAGPVVRREDYRPPAWRVPETALEFELDAERTLVRARLEVVRAEGGREPLRLDGEGLKLLSVKVDGKAAAHKLDRAGLTLRIAGDRAVVETLVELSPAAAAGRQEGLFVLGDMLCTHCDGEGFRRITFFPDRPDVLSRFTVRLVADLARWPVLLSNGNPAGGGETGDGRHWAEWRDPFPKPCYLFALVAGPLAARRDRFVTRSGGAVDLAIWAREEELAGAGHAMSSLKAAMRWDEETYGREYDLDRFGIVALRGFRHQAMENKGLNIFDGSLVLADPETETDADHDKVTAVVAHEYLHNWSGNRVTCRDWFQLGLKEGFTVFRDQQFSAAIGSAAVKRIEDVRALRAAQFPEDAGPRAHPVRPESYRAFSDLLTATVYIKGAEIVRMVETLAGPEAFRAGCDLYFDRHDGEGTSWEDFLAAIGEACGRDLSAFRLWLEQAGTPRLRARLRHDPEAGAVLELEQQVPPTPGEAAKRPAPMPLRVALFGAETGTKLVERLVLFDGAAAEIALGQVAERPLLSINRGFSAPVIVEASRSGDELSRLAACDDDPFARYEALQGLMLHTIVAALRDEEPDHQRVVGAVGQILEDGALEPAFVAEIVLLPSEATIADALDEVDPEAVFRARQGLRIDLACLLEQKWRALQAGGAGDRRELSPAAKGRRRLRNVALDYLMASAAADAAVLAMRQLEQADNMTDREAALRVLADSDAPERTAALAFFHARHRDNPGALDRWFTIQALSIREDTVQVVPKLLVHPDFTLAHPTRLSALVGAFGANPRAFHDRSGRGYRFLADVLLATDRMNPRAAAGLAAPMSGWHRLEPVRAGLLKAQVERILAAGVSPLLSEAIAAGPAQGGSAIW